MKTGSWKVFFAILAATIVIAWVTGMLIVRDILPRWAMIVVNPPFGVVYTWTESLWVMGKGNYYLNGQIISDGQIATIQNLAEIAQAILFYAVWWLWKRVRQGKRKPAVS